MTSSVITENHFNQNEYDNTFYFCEGGKMGIHPFIAFTTCYCPLCDSIEETNKLCIEVGNLEDKLDDLEENHLNLVAKASKYAPELLI